MIYAFDESPPRAGVFWAGTNDGLVHLSRDDGETWTNVTANIPDLPPDGVVRSIDASATTWPGPISPSSTTRSATSRRAPTGRTTSARRGPGSPAAWTTIPSTTRAICSRTRCGRDSSIWAPSRVSTSAMTTGRAGRGSCRTCPPTPYYGLVVQEHFNDLVAGTYGRGYWILDDLSPIQQLTPEIAAAAAHLFEPRDAYRFNPTAEPMIMFADPSAGENPPNGASINYWLGPGGEPDVRAAHRDRRRRARGQSGGYGARRVQPGVVGLPGTGSENRCSSGRSRCTRSGSPCRRSPARAVAGGRRPARAPRHLHRRAGCRRRGGRTGGR